MAAVNCNIMHLHVYSCPCYHISNVFCGTICLESSSVIKWSLEGSAERRFFLYVGVCMLAIVR